MRSNVDEDEAFRKAAYRYIEPINDRAQILIEDDAQVAPEIGDNGAWVQAWIWVPVAEALKEI
jgi:hypothetical protein